MYVPVGEISWKRPGWAASFRGSSSKGLSWAYLTEGKLRLLVDPIDMAAVQHAQPTPILMFTILKTWQRWLAETGVISLSYPRCIAVSVPGRSWWTFCSATARASGLAGAGISWFSWDHMGPCCRWPFNPMLSQNSHSVHMCWPFLEPNFGGFVLAYDPDAWSPITRTWSGALHSTSSRSSPHFCF